MLKSFQLKGLNDIKQLTLDAPKLKKVKLMDCPFSLVVNFVHAEPVETLLVLINLILFDLLFSCPLFFIKARDGEQPEGVR